MIKYPNKLEIAAKAVKVGALQFEIAPLVPAILRHLVPLEVALLQHLNPLVVQPVFVDVRPPQEPVPASLVCAVVVRCLVCENILLDMFG